MCAEMVEIYLSFQFSILYFLSLIFVFFFYGPCNRNEFKLLVWLEASVGVNAANSISINMNDRAGHRIETLASSRETGGRRGEGEYRTNDPSNGFRSLCSFIFSFGFFR